MREPEPEREPAGVPVLALVRGQAPELGRAQGLGRAPAWLEPAPVLEQALAWWEPVLELVPE